MKDDVAGSEAEVNNQVFHHVQSLLEMCRGLPSLDPELPVLVPGDRFSSESLNNN